jgi:hypothetical protein
VPSFSQWLVDRWNFVVHLEDGSKAEWLAGIGAVSALIFAFFAVRAANRQNKHQAEQLANLEEE